MNLNKVIYWTPRGLAILFILFLTMFSLDIFDGNYGFWGTVVGLFMHNIPSLVLLILLIAAWKREFVGAIAFGVAGLLYIATIVVKAINNQFEWYMLSWCLIIAGPAFVVAVLFFINWKRRQNGQL
jgi:hypothetical protein